MGLSLIRSLKWKETEVNQTLDMLVKSNACSEGTPTFLMVDLRDDSIVTSENFNKKEKNASVPQTSAQTDTSIKLAP